MTTAVGDYADVRTEVAGLSVRMLEGGSGGPAMVLHHSTGNVGWSTFHASLARTFQVVAPDMPGYGQSDRPSWARDPQDLAILLNRLLAKLDLRDVTLIGTGLGGFVAAEMATACDTRLAHLVLVGAAGLQPREGEILDQMMVDFDEYIRVGFHDEAKYDELFGDKIAPEVRELWDFSREMTARVTWKPYMFSRKLKPVLSEITIPTLIVWGSDDAVVPLDCAKQYQASIPHARLEIVDGAGHLVDLECPDAVAELIQTAVSR